MSKPTSLRVLLAHTLSQLRLRVFLAVLTLLILTPVLTAVYSITRAGTNTNNTAYAVSPTTLNFQARLLNASGSLVPDGAYNIEFKLYNASSGGSALWTETRLTTDPANQQIVVKNGYLSAYLGDKTSLPTNIWNQQLWLTMNIGGTTGSPTWDGEMTPRIRLTSVPFAFRATAADSAEMLSKNTGSFTGTVDFANLTADRKYVFPDTSLATTASPGTICVFNGTASNCPAASGSAYYLQNDTVLQTQTNFHIQARDNGANGTIGGVISGAANGQTVDLLQFRGSDDSTVLAAVTAGGNLQVASSVDTRTATTLNIGNSTATAVSISKSGVTTTVNGALTVSEATTLNNTLSVSGAANLNGGATIRGLTVNTATATDDQIAVNVTAGGAARFTGSITNGANDLTANRTWTLPNVDGTFITTGNLTAINQVGTITAGTWNGTALTDAYVDDSITIGSSGSVDWTALNNYPAACAAGSAITQLGDSATCSSFATGNAGSYIQNQNAAQQATSNFWISGSGRLDGGLTVAGGASIQGNTTIATTVGNTLGLGNSTGALTVTGNSSSTFVINGVTVDANEFNLLDGKDAALVDINDAINTAITGTGALTTGSINWSGNIATSGNISTSGTGTLAVGGTSTFNAAVTLQNGTATDDRILMSITSAGSAARFDGTITNADLTAARTWTLPDASGTFITTGNLTQITATGTITSGTWQGTAVADTYVADNLTINSSGTVDWTALNNYPAACAAGSAITQLGDTIICTAFATGTAGSYIQNQNSSAQSTSNFWVSGSGRADASFIAPTFTSAAALSLTSGANGDITVDANGTGNTVLNDNVVVAAGKYLKITGGNTASRPTSPTEGMVYFDTDTHQLMVYSNATGTAKWKADGSEAILVAANDSSDADKAAADYVASGTADQNTINAALTAADPASGTRKTGKVYLFAGTYSTTDAILVKNNTMLAGSGSGTFIQFANINTLTKNMIANSDTSTGTGITIRDLRLDGNKATNTSGNQHGISLTNMGGGTGSSARQGGLVTGVTVTGFRAENIYLTGSNNNRISNVVSQDSAVDGILLTGSSSYNTITDSKFQGNAGNGLLANSTSVGNTISGNNAQGNTIAGFQLANSSNNTVSSNTANGNTTVGFNIATSASNNAVTGNAAQGNTGGGFQVGGTNNNFTGNDVSGGTYGFNIIGDYNIVSGNNAQGNTQGVLVSGNHANVSSNTISGGTSYGIILSSSTFSSVSFNKIYDSGGSNTNDAIRVLSSSNNNIIGNTINDTSCTSTCYAIDITSSASTDNYLSNNQLGSNGTIFDNGVRTNYGGQIGSNTSGYLLQTTNLASGNTSALTLLSGNATSGTAGTITVDTGTSSTGTSQINIGTANAGAISIGKLTVTTTNVGNLTVGSSAGSGTLFVNNGATLNTVKAVANDSDGGALGGTPGTPLTAAQSVDIYTSFTINQTTANQTITLPSPTSATAGRLIYIANIGSASFGLLGSTLNAGSTATLMWNGTAWTFAGADGTSINNQKTAGQNGDFWIQAGGGSTGIGRADGGLQAPSLDTASAAALGIGTGSATNITIGHNAGTVSVDGTNFDLATSGLVTLKGGLAADLTTSANTDLTIVANGTGIINLNDSVTIGGNITFANGASRSITVAQATGFNPGDNLTIAAGAGSTTLGDGGLLSLQGGAATAGSAYGGNVNLVGGASSGAGGLGGSVTISGGAGGAGGYQGLVNLSTSAFTSAVEQTFSSSTSITAGNVDLYSSLPVKAITNTGSTLSVPDPANNVVGRLLYIAARSGSLDFTLRLNSSRTPIDISMKQNSTATLIWNGTDWTAAGASSSTDLQAAYNNTLTSAGGAELVLNASGGNADGLTIRNNATTPIVGGLLEVQTSTGSNLLTVNNNATEYALNGGSESGTGTSFTNGWSASATGGTQATVTRETGVGNFVTGIASAKVVTTGATTANQGAADQIAVNGINTALTANLTYTVSFSVRGTSNFTTLDVVYSKDGTNTGTTTCTTGKTVTQSVWSRISCTFIAPSSGITSSNKIFIRQSDSNTSAKTFYIDNLSVNVNANTNHAVDGDADSAANIGAGALNWAAVGGSTVTQSTSTIYNTAGAVSVATSATAGRGVYNKLSNNIVPTSGTQYRVSFYARGDGTNTANLAVAYTPDNGTSTVSCQDYNTQTIAASSWTLINCYFTASGTVSNAQVRITQTSGSATIFYVDALTVTLNSNNANNVQIGGANTGGPTTLLTLDRSSSAPIAANNDAYLGSMYYDTTTGRIQCYEADGWGACGSSPDNIITLTPEYPGAVLGGPGNVMGGGNQTAGIGVMTSEFCSNQTGILVAPTSGNICAAGEARNFYHWTSPQATEQIYSIYVVYKLPTTFKAFNDSNTIKLTALSDNTSNGIATLQVFRKNAAGTAVTACGNTAQTINSTTNTWQQKPYDAADETTCSFSGGDNIIFKIDMKSKSNGNIYVENLDFVFTNN